MGRGGRKRKSGRRHPSGQLVKEKRPDDRIRTSRQPHRRMLSEDDRLSEKAESPIGRMLLTGLLGDPAELGADRYEAGVRYAQIVGSYRSVIEGPRTTSGSGRRSSCVTEETGNHLYCRIYPEDCSCNNRKAKYDRAFEAVMKTGQRAARAVARVAVHREAITAQDLVYLVDGLDALVAHFGLTRRRGGAHS